VAQFGLFSGFDVDSTDPEHLRTVRITDVPAWLLVAAPVLWYPSCSGATAGPSAIGAPCGPVTGYELAVIVDGTGAELSADELHTGTAPTLS